MSERDRRLAREKYGTRKSASDVSKEREEAKVARKGAKEARIPQQRRPDSSAHGGTDLGVMRGLLSQPRTSESRQRARASQVSASDASGGEAYADRSARSITKWFGSRG